MAISYVITTGNEAGLDLADFAERVEKSGFQFIGPTPESIRIMGLLDEIRAQVRANA